MKIKAFWDEKTSEEKKMLRKKAIAIGVTVVGIAITGVVIWISKTGSQPYSSSWLKTLSDAELGAEREKARLAYRDAGNNYDLACKWDHLRRMMDAEIDARKNVDFKDYVFPVHGEHGTNLYKPD